MMTENAEMARFVGQVKATARIALVVVIFASFTFMSAPAAVLVSMCAFLILATLADLTWLVRAVWRTLVCLFLILALVVAFWVLFGVIDVNGEPITAFSAFLHDPYHHRPAL